MLCPKPMLYFLNLQINAKIVVGLLQVLPRSYIVLLQDYWDCAYVPWSVDSDFSLDAFYRTETLIPSYLHGM